jgi:peptidoglycan/LPS O-acetylase OafA/YrhL
MKRDYVGELDLLRFVAALAVLVFHIGFRGGAADGLSPLIYEELMPVAKYGYLGVDLFFMISGFVIMMSAQAESVGKFIVSRLTRLYPAFWICCSITFLAILLSETVRFPSSSQTYLINMTMLAGSTGTKFLDGSYWSLAIELKFYFLVALVILTGQINNAEKLVYAWLLVAVVAQFVKLPWVETKLIIRFAPYFAAGAIFYFIRSHGGTPLRWVAIVTSWLLALDRALVNCAEQTQHYNVPHSVTVVCMLTTLFFVVFAAISLRRTGALGRYRWPMLGAITYPLYLIHQTVGYLLITEFYPTVNTHVLFWGTVGLSLLSAYLISRYLERPLALALRSLLELGGRAIGRLSFRT